MAGKLELEQQRWGCEEAACAPGVLDFMGKEAEFSEHWFSHGERGPAPACLGLTSKEDVRPKRGGSQVISVPWVMAANVKHI